jgi:hypothetical protein
MQSKFGELLVYAIPVVIVVVGLILRWYTSPSA